jgi:hypothetical protein
MKKRERRRIFFKNGTWKEEGERMRIKKKWDMGGRGE